MKKAKLLVVAILIGLVLPLALSAQVTNYTWKSYNLAFSIPKTHVIQDNSADHFESGDDRTWLELLPYKDGSATTQDVVVEYILNSDFLFEVTKEGDYRVNNLEGYYAVCVSESYPEWYFWIIGYIDPNSENNYISIIWWKKNDSGAQKIANAIANSMRSIQYSFSGSCLL